MPGVCLSPHSPTRPFMYVPVVSPFQRVCPSLSTRAQHHAPLFSPPQGNIELEVNRVDSDDGEIGGVFVSTQFGCVAYAAYACSLASCLPMVTGRRASGMCLLSLQPACLGWFVDDPHPVPFLSMHTPTSFHVHNPCAHTATRTWAPRRPRRSSSRYIGDTCLYTHLAL